jgi:hypothetical protein
MRRIQARATRFCNVGPSCVIVTAMKPVSRWFVGVCWALATLFSLSAGLQINDPDPYVWMPAYLGAALAIGILPARRMLAIPAAVLGLGAGAWAGLLVAEVWDKIAISDLWNEMSAYGGAVEVGREAGGLAIVAVGLLGCAAVRARRA